MASNYTDRQFQGTYLFDGQMAKKGYGLNKMCYSFNDQAARDEFNADPEAYCEKFKLTQAQKKRFVTEMLLGFCVKVAVFTIWRNSPDC